MIIFSAFTGNKEDPDMVGRAKKAMQEMNTFAFDQGSLPWKPTVEEQKMTMEKIDPNTLKLMKVIRENLDPNGIINPGIWQVN